jgi:hypothetical protein
MAICVQCHRFKTRNDIQQIRKSDRQRDRHTGVVRPKQTIKSAGFPKTRKERPAKAELPQRPLYAAKEELA